MSGKTKGGRKRTLTNLESRRQTFDNSKSKDAPGYKRPGSNKK